MKASHVSLTEWIQLISLPWCGHPSGRWSVAFLLSFAAQGWINGDRVRMSPFLLVQILVCVVDGDGNENQCLDCRCSVESIKLSSICHQWRKNNLILMEIPLSLSSFHYLLQTNGNNLKILWDPSTKLLNTWLNGLTNFTVLTRHAT